MRFIPLMSCLLPLACGVQDRGQPDVQPAAEPAARVAPGEPRNVLLVVVDTLRTDRVGVYGSKRPTTPAIDSVAARGLRYDRAYATAPWTMPTVASVLTGLLPAVHGVTHVRRRIPAGIDTLPELLSARGVDTTGIVSNVLLTQEHGFDQGFGHFDSQASNGHRFVGTELVTDAAVSALRRHAASDRPFFLMAHYFDPHYDYMPHDGVDWAPDRAGTLTTDVEIVSIRDDRARLTEEELTFLGDLYDEEVWFTDQGVARLLSELDALALTQDTLIIVLADHGEELMEHGWLGHTRSMYEEVVRVPLVMAGPGVPIGEVIETPVTLASITPTVLSRLGMLAEVGEGKFQASPLPAGEDVVPEPVFIEVDFVPINEISESKRAHLTAVVGQRLKFIRDENSGVIEAYDLATDPGERADLVAASPSDVDRFRAVLDGEQSKARKRPVAPVAPVEVELDDERTSQLERLGYLE